MFGKTKRYWQTGKLSSANKQILPRKSLKGKESGIELCTEQNPPIKRIECVANFVRHSNFATKTIYESPPLTVKQNQRCVDWMTQYVSLTD